ncbi:13220_t:CDS:1, partial [Gigaspora rosea]
AVVPSQSQSVSSPLTLNNNLYIFNTQNYTWDNPFDVSNMYVSNSTKLKDSSISIVVIAGFLIYKKIRARNLKATFERYSLLFYYAHIFILYLWTDLHIN